MLYKIILTTEKTPKKKIATTATTCFALQKNITNYLCKAQLLPVMTNYTTNDIAIGLTKLLLQSKIPETPLLISWITQIITLEPTTYTDLNYHLFHLNTRVAQQMRLAQPAIKKLTTNLEAMLPLFENITNKAKIKRHTRLTETIAQLRSPLFAEQRQGIMSLGIILPAYVYDHKKDIPAYVFLKNCYALIDPHLATHMETTLLGYYRHSIKKIATTLTKLALSTQATGKQIKLYEKTIAALLRESTHIPQSSEGLEDFVKKCLFVFHSPKTQYIFQDDTEETTGLTAYAQKLNALCLQIKESLGGNTPLSKLHTILQKATVPRNDSIVKLLSQATRFLKKGTHEISIIPNTKPNSWLLYIDKKNVPNIMFRLWGVRRQIQDTLGTLHLSLGPTGQGQVFVDAIKIKNKNIRSFFLCKKP